MTKIRKTWTEKEMIVGVLFLLIVLNAGSAFAVGAVRLVAQSPVHSKY